ncbi:MAG: phospholipase D family protein [Idiomarina sp.]
MVFILQNPEASSLAESIDNLANGADCGGGVFAFASKGGIDTLLGSNNIRSMLERGGTFRLTVGVDAITNAEALLCLESWLERFPGVLETTIFYHTKRDSTFHPKFCWFQHENRLCLLTGSGNLTKRGLGRSADGRHLGNWEAFSFQDLTGSEKEAAQTEIQSWLDAQRNAGRLRLPDDEDVRERAMTNGRVRFISNTAGDASVTTTDTDPDSTDHRVLVDDGVFSTPEVLVRELPRNRSGQADIGKRALTKFFGYEGQPKNVLIQHVSLNNVNGEVEEIRMFVNSSSNYRLELRAITYFPYEVRADDSRMILVATKLDMQSFRYTVVPITDENYDQVSSLLNPLRNGQRRVMRENLVTPENLKSAWPKVPSNLLPIELFTSEL